MTNICKYNFLYDYAKADGYGDGDDLGDYGKDYNGHTLADGYGSSHAKENGYDYAKADGYGDGDDLGDYGKDYNGHTLADGYGSSHAKENGYGIEYDYGNGCGNNNKNWLSRVLGDNIRVRYVSILILITGIALGTVLVLDDLIIK